MYMTNGKVPETIITSNTSDISQICEFGWYDWVMFRDNIPTFPDNKKTLATQWMVSPERAQWTVQQTKQRGVCTCLNSMLA
jgi:hypothetical protein